MQKNSTRMGLEPWTTLTQASVHGAPALTTTPHNACFESCRDGGEQFPLGSDFQNQGCPTPVFKG